jgi:hypothetical protein
MPRRKKNDTSSQPPTSKIKKSVKTELSKNISTDEINNSSNLIIPTNSVDLSVNNVVEEPVKIKQKRGRKPKPKPENYEPPKPKKRGRKPKDKFKFDDLTTARFEPEKTEDNNFIVKLPVSCKELDNELNISGHLNYNPNLSVPSGIDNSNLKNFYCYDNSILDQNIISTNSLSMDDNNIIENDNNIIENDNNIIENNHNIIENDNNTSCNDKKINNKNNISIIKNIQKNQKLIIKQKDIMVKNKNQVKLEHYNERVYDLLEDVIQDDSKKEMTQIEKLLNKKYKQTKQIHLLHSVCITTQNNEWIRHTDISCFWCCHNFNHTPWGIPIKYDYYSKIFTLFGIYCSPNCALAYLLQNENNSTALWENVSLLNLLHYKVYKTDENIVPAPDKICLKKFGGPLTVEQYRSLTLKNNKNYCVNFPPCSMVSPVLEETKKAFNQDSFFIPMDKNKINQIQTNLKIKRTKPINCNKNTLDNVIQINYK